MQNEELSDLNSRGKERPWKKHKLRNQKVIELLHILGDHDKAHKIELCGNVLEFAACPDGHGKWLKHALFCKDRACVTCIYRKSLFTFRQFIQVSHKIIEIQPDTAFLFLTLTIKNCDVEDLTDTITHLNESYARLVRRKKIKAAFDGVFKSLEVTYNAETNTFHPHIHAVVAVRKTYFQGKYYISHEELKKLWQKALKVDYEPDCWIEKVKPRRKKLNTINEDILLMDQEMMNQIIVDGAGEVAKYSVKIGDILNPTIGPNDSPEMIKAKLRLREDPRLQAEVLRHLMRGLSNRRLICYTGIFKKAYQALKCTDVEDSDLIMMPGEESVCKCKICGSELVQIHYIWNGEGYFEWLRRAAKSPKSKVAAPFEVQRQKVANVINF